ncbi:DUF3298 and DUF4163 domain-containing protein [Aquimarina sp. 2304DJ70-9]|uniref:DUF3298 and DUF4163 domain-containing protein n=1 Tax=Aquimarina penaris TaxID=3231044 RepID=UPI003461C42F
MINTKPNTYSKIVVVLVILMGLSSCTKRESFTFEKQNFAVDQMLDCSTIDCASLEINLLKVTDDSQISSTINKEIEKVACAVLNIGENQPEGSMKQAMQEFNNSYQKISTEFPDEIVPYEATIDCELGFQSESLISVVMDSYVFTGGAHGYGGISYINIDTKTGKRIVNTDLFKNYKGFVHHAEKVFRSKHEILESESINSTGFFFENETFSLPENIGFTEKEVILFYNPYEISSYAEGAIEIKMNKDEVASFFAFEIL